ncbi:MULTISPECIES: hypothetical protein [Methylomonas]|uniref:Uncharacterized protein n=2 Tax=Methylomonas TaxID=416 RepID=A0A140E5G9_9GAMM|nr:MULTISPECIES: hypothetical protein [Methylomonas]AMK75643.1 hypothetical protein JT25_003935 [Methylomonas denitrificans]OAH96149.1 hypothetical protein A1342_06685 [Methylomonas methanica]TCV75253.1 hypothetical protein EDE11_13515 [Methylomonas methanica]
MAIQKEFVLRYRQDGHVRFQVPAEACQPAVAALISKQLAALNGVQSVSLYRGQGKLSIRYDETICGFSGLATQLFQILAELEQQGHFERKPLAEQARTSVLGIKKRLKRTRIGGWFSKKYQAGKETVQAAKIIGKVGAKGPKALFKDPEKATIDFLNDVLVLYLIKTHWNRITQEWLVKPIVHRYEWMAVFYMFFLLVRSRRPK